MQRGWRDPLETSRRPLVRFVRVIGLLCLLASAVGLLLRAAGMPVHAVTLLSLVGLGIASIAWTTALGRRAHQK